MSIPQASLARFRAVGRWTIPVFAVLVLAVGCTVGQAPRVLPVADSLPPPMNAKLVCGADGSTRLSTDRVQPQRDGVHLLVINEFKEPVSVEGFDANPGRTNWVLADGPGPLALMCWPFSQHTSGVEPSRVTLAIEDPSHLYFDGSVDCPIESASTVDLGEQPVDYGPPSLGRASKVIPGLQPGDALYRAGYPLQDHPSVAVIRDREVVASYGIVRFAGQPWRVLTGTACAGTGLMFAGQSVG